MAGLVASARENQSAIAISPDALLVMDRARDGAEIHRGPVSACGRYPSHHVRVEANSPRSHGSFDHLAVSQGSAFRRRRSGLLEAASRRGGTPILYSVCHHRRRRYRRVSLVTHRHRAGADSGFHDLRDPPAGRQPALLSGIPAKIAGWNDIRAACSWGCMEFPCAT